MMHLQGNVLLSLRVFGSTCLLHDLFLLDIGFLLRLRQGNDILCELLNGQQSQLIDWGVLSCWWVQLGWCVNDLLLLIGDLVGDWLHLVLAEQVYELLGILALEEQLYVQGDQAGGIGKQHFKWFNLVLLVCNPHMFRVLLGASMVVIVDWVDEWVCIGLGSNGLAVHEFLISLYVWDSHHLWVYLQPQYVFLFVLVYLVQLLLLMLTFLVFMRSSFDISLSNDQSSDFIVLGCNLEQSFLEVDDVIICFQVNFANQL